MYSASPFSKQPFNSSPFRAPFGKSISAPQRARITAPIQQRSEKDAPRVVQYAADMTGCGFWRLFWPEHILNANEKLISTTTTVIDNSPNFYAPVKAVRVQRQASSDQKEFIKYLCKLRAEFGFKLIYEIDDVVFHEDIPDYNRYKYAFEPEEVRNNIIEIINMCDEVSVTNEFMKEYFREKTGKHEITTIPNFVPGWWMGQYFNPNRLSNSLIKHKKKPRILYSGSGSHFDVDNKTNNKDDFEQVIQSIIDTRHQFTWIFIGSAPNPLVKYINSGEIEFHPWQKLYQFPRKIYDIDAQMMVAPLQANNFNKCKSDIKYIESSCYGIPIACQDIVTYKDAPIKFNSGEEMIDKIKSTLKNTKKYIEDAHAVRAVAESRFLERDENQDCYVELFTTPYGCKTRKNLMRFNNNI